MNRHQNPPGVTYEGGDGIYHVLLHGEQVGLAVSTWGLPQSKGKPCWAISAHADGRWAWTAPTRHQAVEGLIAWLETQP